MFVDQMKIVCIWWNIALSSTECVRVRASGVGGALGVQITKSALTVV
jgi:hypothetical protein